MNNTYLYINYLKQYILKQSNNYKYIYYFCFVLIYLIKN